MGSGCLPSPARTTPRGAPPTATTVWCHSTNAHMSSNTQFTRRMTRSTYELPAAGSVQYTRIFFTLKLDKEAKITNTSLCTSSSPSRSPSLNDISSWPPYICITYFSTGMGMERVLQATRTKAQGQPWLFKALRLTKKWGPYREEVFFFCIYKFDWKNLNIIISLR